MSPRSEKLHCENDGCHFSSNSPQQLFNHFCSSHAVEASCVWRRFLAHRRTWKGSENSVMHCDKCGYKTMEKSHFAVHQAGRHGWNKDRVPKRSVRAACRCDLCSQQSMSKNTLILHMRRCHHAAVAPEEEAAADSASDSTLVCDSCNHACKGSRNLFHHILSRHALTGSMSALHRTLRRRLRREPVISRHMSCDECGKTVNGTAILKRHFLRHHADRSKGGWRRMALREKSGHAYRSANRERASCDICAKILRGRNTLLIHIAAKRCPASPVCDECGAGMDGRRLSRHVATKHLGRSKRIRRCDECPFVTRQSRQNLLSHLSRAHPLAFAWPKPETRRQPVPQSIACDTCGSQQRGRRSLVAHYLSHHADLTMVLGNSFETARAREPKCFRCDDCGAVEKGSQKGLARHFDRLHALRSGPIAACAPTNSRNFSCDSCDFATHARRDLTSHLHGRLHQA